MVVTGARTKVVFTNATFIDCCLVVTDGATATLEDCNFTASYNTAECHSFGQGICLYVSGIETHASMQGGSVTGALRGAMVKDGASLYANSVQLTGEQWVAVEVQGLGTCTQLKDCTLMGCSASPATSPKLSPVDDTRTQISAVRLRQEEVLQSIGVLCGSGANCSIEECAVLGFKVGFSASSCHVQLLNTDIEDSLLSCCELRSVLVADITGCDMRGSLGTGHAGVRILLLLCCICSHVCKHG